MMVTEARILVVEPEPGLRDRLKRWLREEGFDVLWCAGPSPPEYLCPWAEGEECWAPGRADLVVLDLWLESDTHRRGTRGRDVLAFYRSLGLPVVALGGLDDRLPTGPDAGVELLRGVPERDEVVRAVRRLLRIQPQASSAPCG